MPDIQKSVKARRKKLSKLWNTKAWKDAVKKYIQDYGGKCQWCGSAEYLTVHHLYRSAYGQEVYMQLSPSQNIILCRSCHFQLHRGRDRCKCGKFKPMEVDKCWDCLCAETPELQEKMKYLKDKKKRDQKEYRSKKYQESKAKQKKWKEDHESSKNKKDSA